MHLILAGFHDRLKRERDGRAWLATHIEAVRRHDELLMPWELTGDEDPDVGRRDQKRADQEAAALRIIGVPKSVSVETPEQVLARFGILKGDA
jgi:hypothetical protein